jgi:hypothetical protein
MSMGMTASFRVAALSSLLSTSCYHYYVKADRVPPATEWRSNTQVAYAWGLIQPNDIVPANCPRHVPLAEVSATTNLGFVLIGVVTLGIVLPHELAWRCAKPPAADDATDADIVRGAFDPGEEWSLAPAVP